jgi:hypothetical protein
MFRKLFFNHLSEKYPNPEQVTFAIESVSKVRRMSDGKFIGAVTGEENGRKYIGNRKQKAKKCNSTVVGAGGRN